MKVGLSSCLANFSRIHFTFFFLPPPNLFTSPTRILGCSDDFSTPHYLAAHSVLPSGSFNVPVPPFPLNPRSGPDWTRVFFFCVHPTFLTFDSGQLLPPTPPCRNRFFSTLSPPLFPLASPSLIIPVRFFFFFSSLNFFSESFPLPHQAVVFSFGAF